MAHFATRQTRHRVTIGEGYTGKTKTLGAIHASVALEAEYRRRLEKLVDEMNRSIAHFLTRTYRSNPPATEVLAMDDMSSTALIRELSRLSRRWTSRFDEASKTLARFFSKRAQQRSDAALRGILKKAGMTVQFSVTDAQVDALRATTAANVGLIKSIASEHLTDVGEIVMRGVQSGRGLKEVTDELEHRYGLTRDRAALIARDQNRKATATMTRVRQVEMGINRARWVHSAGGRHPREEHVAFSKGRLGGPFYDADKGAFLEGRWTWPGFEINCRCVSRPVLEGFD